VVVVDHEDPTPLCHKLGPLREACHARSAKR
jgi:hypothetical protein